MMAHRDDAAAFLADWRDERTPLALHVQSPGDSHSVACRIGHVGTTTVRLHALDIPIPQTQPCRSDTVRAVATFLREGTAAATYRIVNVPLRAADRFTITDATDARTITIQHGPVFVTWIEYKPMQVLT